MSKGTGLTLGGVASNLEEANRKDNLAIGTMMTMVFELPLPMEQPRITAVKFQDLGTSFRVILTGVDGRKPVIAFLQGATMATLCRKMWGQLSADRLKWKIDDWALARLDED